MSAPDEIRRRVSETAATAKSLVAMDDDLVLGALAAAAASLADAKSDIGAEARLLLTQSTGLSTEMVDWGLTSASGAASPGGLHALARSLRAPVGSVLSRARLMAVVLSGNVFSAPLRPIVASLLARVPVVAKASSRDDIFPRLLARAIAAASEELAASFDVFTFKGGETSLEDALFAQADAVAAYGSDATLREIRGRLSATTTFVPHGHGLGAIWIPRASLDQDDVASRVALDVAAYDQRGCLSPHVVWVGADRSRADRFAERLAGALETLRTKLPRGELPMERGAQQLQWRGVGATRGELFEGDGFAVTSEGDGPLRLSPGYRNVSVLTCADEEQLGRRLQPLGVHLKALGVAGSSAERRVLARRLPSPLAPRISEVGTMQMPPLSSLADGQSPWSGLVRYTQVD